MRDFDESFQAVANRRVGGKNRENRYFKQISRGYQVDNARFYCNPSLLYGVLPISIGAAESEVSTELRMRAGFRADLWTTLDLACHNIINW